MDNLPLSKLTDFEEFQDESNMFDDFKPSSAPSPYASPHAISKDKENLKQQTQLHTPTSSDNGDTKKGKTRDVAARYMTKTPTNEDKHKKSKPTSVRRTEQKPSVKDSKRGRTTSSTKTPDKTQPTGGLSYAERAKLEIEARNAQDLTTPYYLRKKGRPSILPNSLQTPSQTSSRDTKSTITKVKPERPKDSTTSRANVQMPSSRHTQQQPASTTSTIPAKVEKEKPQNHATTKKNDEKEDKLTSSKAKPQGASSSTRSLVDINHELALLQTGLLQWCYANAKAEESFKAQSESAEQQLYAATQYVLALQDEVLEKKISLSKDRRAWEEAETIERQHALLGAEFEKELTEMIHNYESLSKALGVTMSRLPMSGVIVPTQRGKGRATQSLEEQLCKQFEESEALLKCFATRMAKEEESQGWMKEEEREELEAMQRKMEVSASCASDLALLEETIIEELEELAKCQDLLGEALYLENHERSLRFHYIQAQQQEQQKYQQRLKGK